MSTVPVTNPFVGPRSFETGETLFGRDREIRELFGLLVSERIVLLHSPSGRRQELADQGGTGPGLRQEGFHVWPVIRVNTEPSRGDPARPGRPPTATSSAR